MAQKIAEVKVKRTKINPVVWVVPLLAFMVGGWMIYKYYAQLGPMVTIVFKKSGGLEPKQSYIKFRDVKVGVIEKVEILKKEEGVVVYARMNKDVAPFLNETTKFWIVKPEIGMGKIQGLDALVSGAYVQMYAHLGKERRYRFQGLDEVPLNLNEVPGSTYELVAENSYGLNMGDPVYYRQMRVGRVEKVLLPPSGKEVKIYIFVKKPYDRLVNASSRFWNISYANVELKEDGIGLQMHPLSQLLIGGIAFSTKDREGNTTRPGSFYLYPSKDLALRKRVGVGAERFVEFVMPFDKKSGYLHIGAPVKIDGYTIGEVTNILSTWDMKRKKINSYVIAKIDISAFKEHIDDDPLKNLQKLVQEGLRARMQESIPLLHRVYINLVFTSKSGRLKRMGAYYSFPTDGFRQGEIEAILQKIEKMPLQKSLEAFSNFLENTQEPLRKTLQNLQKSLADIDRLLGQKSIQELPSKVKESLERLDRTLESFNALAKSYAKGSLFKQKLEALIKDLDKAANDVDKLVKKLKRKPNAIIFGD